MNPDLHRLRQGVYRVLSAGFDPPSEAFLTIASGSQAVLDGLGLWDYAFGPHVADMLTRFAAADVDDLRTAHVQLFEIGVDGRVCTPRESARLGDSRTGDVARILAELRSRYELLDMPVSIEADRLDHVSTELAAMAALCGAAAAGHNGDRDLADQIERQAAFANDHVLRWVPMLARELSGVGPHSAYAALGAATLAFLEHERQHLPILVELTGDTVR